MGTPLTFRFDAMDITVQTSADGRIWFSAEAICQILQFPDSRAALLYHCRPTGILFGDEQAPQAMIDLRNLLQLSQHGVRQRARHLHEWLCEVVLPVLLGHAAVLVTSH